MTSLKESIRFHFSVVLQKEPFYVLMGNLFSTGLATIFWFSMANLLTPSSYGTVNFVLSAATMGAIVATAGLSTTLMTYLPKEHNTLLVREANSVTFLLSLAVAAFFIIQKMLLASLLLICEVSFAMHLSKVLGERDYRHYAHLVVGSRITQISVSILFFFLVGTTGIIVGYTLPLFAFSFPYFKHLKPNVRLREIRSKFSFAMESYGTHLVTGFQNYLDKVVVGLFFGFATLGFYNLAYQIFLVMSVLPGSVFQYLLPQKATGSSLREIETLAIFFSVCIAFVFFLITPTLFSLVFPKFFDAIPLVRLSCFAVVPATAANIQRASLFGQEKSKLPLIAGFLATVFMFVALISLGLLYGTVGLGVAIVISQTALLISLILLGKVIR